MKQLQCVSGPPIWAAFAFSGLSVDERPHPVGTPATAAPCIAAGSQTFPPPTYSCFKMRRSRLEHQNDIRWQYPGYPMNSGNFLSINGNDRTTAIRHIRRLDGLFPV